MSRSFEKELEMLKKVMLVFAVAVLLEGVVEHGSA